MYRNELPEGTICAFWRARIEDGITIARYYRTEQRTPFDIHWTTRNDYFISYSANIEEAIELFRNATAKKNELPHFIV